MIWDGFDQDNLYEHPFGPAKFYAVGLDYGTSNATAAVLASIDPTTWPQIRIEEEYYYDSVKKGRTKTDAQLVDDIYAWLQHKSIQAIYVDPAAASLKAEMRQRGMPVLDAKNDVINGIRTVGKFISHKNLVIHKGCTNLIDSINSYIWDPVAVNRGEDKPLKKFDHCADALKYLIYSLYPQGSIHSIDNDITIAQVKKQIYGDNESLWGNNDLSGYY
jgi:phage terminase large subunit